MGGNPRLTADVLCAGRCGRTWELVLDGYPYCLDCADRIADRRAAVEINPALAAKLPPAIRPPRGGRWDL